MRTKTRFASSFLISAAWLGAAAVLSSPVLFGAGIEQDKEPIRSTQSEAVAVTPELLKREGDLGPASPTFKMSDTSRFLTKKPFDKHPGDAQESGGKEDKSWWENWFSWLDFSSGDDEENKNETR